MLLQNHQRNTIRTRYHQLLDDRGHYHIETSPLICIANQWTGFYMIGTSIIKELNIKDFIEIHETVREFADKKKKEKQKTNKFIISNLLFKEGLVHGSHLLSAIYPSYIPTLQQNYSQSHWLWVLECLGMMWKLPSLYMLHWIWQQIVRLE